MSNKLFRHNILSCKNSSLHVIYNKDREVISDFCPNEKDLDFTLLVMGKKNQAFNELPKKD